MSKKTILFICLFICFLIVLVVFAYVKKCEKDGIAVSSCWAPRNDNIEVTPRNDIGAIGILKIEEDDKWADITPEYFLTEDIFDSGARTGLVEFNTPDDEEIDNMFVRRWYNENDVPFIIITIMEYKDKNFDSEDSIQIEPGLASGTSEDTIMTYLDGFTFQDEVVSERKVEIKKGQSIETTFHLDWLKNRFSFLIRAISAEYQDDIKEIAKNIINKYPK